MTHLPKVKDGATGCCPLKVAVGDRDGLGEFQADLQSDQLLAEEVAGDVEVSEKALLGARQAVIVDGEGVKVDAVNRGGCSTKVQPAWRERPRTRTLEVLNLDVRREALEGPLDAELGAPEVVVELAEINEIEVGDLPREAEGTRLAGPAGIDRIELVAEPVGALRPEVLNRVAIPDVDVPAARPGDEKILLNDRAGLELEPLVDDVGRLARDIESHGRPALDLIGVRGVEADSSDEEQNGHRGEGRGFARHGTSFAGRTYLIIYAINCQYIIFRYK